MERDAKEAADDDGTTVDLRAFERERLTSHFQAIYDLSDGTLVGAEALLRWVHPDYGTFSASEFLRLGVNEPLRHDIADRALVSAAGAWVDLREHTERGVPDLYLNVDPLQLADLAATERIRHVLVATGLPADHVVIEVSERVTTLDVGAINASMARLIELGTRLAIDDFGGEHSSLARLRELPVSIIKIDRALVAGVDVDDRARRLLGAVVDLARALGLDAIAECVETGPELAVVRDLGVRFAQGFALSPPVPADEFGRSIRGSAGRPVA